jgi:hypothetical protein
MIIEKHPDNRSHENEKENRDYLYKRYGVRTCLKAALRFPKIKSGCAAHVVIHHQSMH